MSAMDELLIEPFRRMMADISSPAKVRAAESSGAIGASWAAIEASGFLDALVPEDAGGAGLSLEDVLPLVASSGAAALPMPFAETMVARGLLHVAGIAAPAGARIVLAPPSPIVPLAAVASHALVPHGDGIALVEVRREGAADPFRALGGAVEPAAWIASFAADGVDLLVVAAGLVAAKMSGAMERVLAQTLRFAGQREQFGRPIGKFQAVQQQIAIMAEQVISARMAAAIGMTGDRFDPLRVAAAKCRAGEASHQVCAIAHGVHGAIGVTEDYDLQLLTRRLKQWQMSFGSELYWARRLGAARLAARSGHGADFVRLNLA